MYSMQHFMAKRGEFCNKCNNKWTTYEQDRYFQFIIQNKVSVVVVVMKKVGAAVWSFLLSVMLSSLFSGMVSHYTHQCIASLSRYIEMPPTSRYICREL